MTKTEAAYVAGFFDGEGSIYITYNPKNNFILQAAICNTNKEILEWICERTPLKLYRMSDNGKRTKPCYQATAGSKSAIEFLGQIEPFTKSKLGHIEVARQFMKTQIHHRKGIKLTEEERKEKDNFRLKMCKLNGRIKNGII